MTTKGADALTLLRSSMIISREATLSSSTSTAAITLAHASACERFEMAMANIFRQPQSHAEHTEALRQMAANLLR